MLARYADSVKTAASKISGSAHMMDILFKEPDPIPLHAIAAMIAIMLGGIQLVMKKGGTIHVFIGKAWVFIILVVAFSSFFIHQIQFWGLYSPIHLLSILTIILTAFGINLARQGKIKRHGQVMAALYGFALILAGLFTLLPGRVMHAVFFG